MLHPIRLLATFAVLGTIASQAHAENQPAPKGPPKTMGSEGKLPATGTMSGQTPEMGGGEGTAPSGGVKRMGDEHKLPATGTMSGATPRMTPPAGGQE